METMEKFAQKIDTKYRRLTAPIRMMPNFIIIGTQKGGTTSLFKYLIQHPNILPPTKKEVHFFDFNFNNNPQGIRRYRSHFPLNTSLLPGTKNNFITGEATPYYMFHPHAAKRIAQILPQVKLIVLLRNPVDRAYSHYSMQVQKGRENLSFAEAISQEKERLGSELEKMNENDNYNSSIYSKYSYLSRGIYINQLRTWFQLFYREQFLIIKSEDFFQETSRIYNEILDFLHLPTYKLNTFHRHGSTKKHSENRQISLETRKYLVEYFQPHNQELYEYLDRDFEWETVEKQLTISN